MKNESVIIKERSEPIKNQVSLNYLDVVVEEERIEHKEKADFKNSHNSAISGLYIGHIQSTFCRRFKND